MNEFVWIYHNPITNLVKSYVLDEFDQKTIRYFEKDSLGNVKKLIRNNDKKLIAEMTNIIHNGFIHVTDEKLISRIWPNWRFEMNV